MRKDSRMILAELEWGNFVAPVGTQWKHKKGGVYRVTGHAFSTVREEVDVVYVRLAGPQFNPNIDPHIPFERPVREWTQDRFQIIQ